MIDHMPARMSPAVREGIIRAAITFENASVITSTGSIATWPAPTGIRGSGSHRSHCVVCPGSWTSLSTGSASRNSGRSSRTRSLRTVSERSHPMRSAITVAGILENSLSNARICGSTASTMEPFNAR